MNLTSPLRCAVARFYCISSLRKRTCLTLVRHPLTYISGPLLLFLHTFLLVLWHPAPCPAPFGLLIWYPASFPPRLRPGFAAPCSECSIFHPPLPHHFRRPFFPAGSQPELHIPINFPLFLLCLIVCLPLCISLSLCV